MLGELQPNPDAVDHVTWHHYSSDPEKARARRRLYDYAELEPEVDETAGIADVYDRAYYLLDEDIRAGSSFLDVGCGGGDDLLRLRYTEEHTGQLVGLDISHELFQEAKSSIQRHNLRPIDFIVGDAQNIPLDDHSIDVTTAFNMLHTLGNPARALNEIARVTKEGGKAIITTRMEKNKQRHGEFLGKIAEQLGILPPAVSTRNFDFYVASQVLPWRFRVIDTHLEYGRMIFKDEKGIQDYLTSLGSMRDSFTPSLEGEEYDELWASVINTVVVPVILREIESKGYYTDTIHRHLWSCENNSETINAVVQPVILDRIASREDFANGINHYLQLSESGNEGLSLVDAMTYMAWEVAMRSTNNRRAA